MQNITSKIFCYGLSFYIIAFVIPAGTLLAQQRTITGNVKSNTNEPLPSASVKLLDEKSTIISYAISNQKGDFILYIPAGKSSSPLWLEVSYIGYRKQQKPINTNNPAYQFILIPDPNTLEEVKIKNRPYAKHAGDTLSYTVTRFAQKEDRSIGDVLRRIPGIDIAGDGTIYYNGKEIENLYIQGDDLMNGRYGLASKVIRKEMIASVDVIRNHQPIKVLKDKMLSDKTAINLVLKDENSLKASMQATVAAGLPEQYDVSFTPVLLNKRIKMINTVASNNIGTDYRNDFKQPGASNMISNIANDLPEINLSLATTGPPDLPLSSYYFNKSAIVNLNNLYNTKNEVQFKVNIQGFYDKSSMNYSGYSAYYSANDTVNYTERQKNYSEPLELNTSFNVMVNKERYFFNNNLKINVSKETDNSFMNFNDSSFKESLNKTLNEISNDLNWIPAFKGKNIGEFRWLVRYTHNRDILNIGKGYYADVISQQGNYDSVIQQAGMPSLFSNAWFSYKIPGNIIKQEYKFGIITESQQLHTDLGFIKNGLSQPYMGDSGNDLKWKRSDVYISPEYQFERRKLKSTLQLPVSYQYVHYWQQEYQLNEKNKQIVFNPLLKIYYDIGPEQYLSFSYAFKNTFGNIMNIYRGAILENYRTLQANDADLQEKKIHSLSLYYDFRKSVILLFMNAGITFDKITANTIVSTSITDSIQEVIALPYKNSQTNTALNAGISKYFFDLKTTVSLKARLNKHCYEQFVNNELLPFYSTGLLLNARINKKMFQAVSFTYQPTLFWNNATLKENKTSGGMLIYKAFRSEQNLSIGSGILKRLYLELNARHTYSSLSNSNNVQYFFMDSKIQYTTKKKNTDIALNVTNLLNVKHYTLYSDFYNQLSINQYNIRGRMIIIKFAYYL
ncbi:hypothetical protein [Parafilimonas sp.]|uniref:hypothetical protein n=1 Tax=Parafilimonas sp. TaxID=1969739 RepID=UPI0039E518C7